jgi:RNA polymerase sigma-70 factor (ECF subfamily)
MAHPGKMTDSEIIQKIREGEVNQYRQIVERYQQLVFRTCMGFLHNREDADDLTQEIFIRTYQALGEFRGTSAFSTWIYRIAVNASLNRVRKSSGSQFFKRLESVFSPEKKIDLFAEESENPEIIIIRKEQKDRVTRAIDSLPENQRTAIVLSHYDDLSQREIAEIMQTTEGAVEALLQRGKASLRKKLSDIRKKN